MNQIISFKMKLLYLYGVLLYAVLAVIFIFSLPNIQKIALDANQFIVDSHVKLYWGLFFGPIFLIFVFGPIRKALRHWKSFKLLDWVYVAWLVVDLIALAVGFARGNNYRYLFGDTFVFAIVPLSYFLVKDEIKDYAQAKSLFYFMLAVQFIVIMFPVDWAMIQPYESVPSRIGLYGFHSSEAFVTVAMMAFALLGSSGKQRYLFLGLFIIALLISLCRTRTIFLIQLFFCLAVLALVHSSRKFIRDIFAMFLVVFLAIFLAIGASNNFKKVYFFQTHYMYTKATQMLLSFRRLVGPRDASLPEGETAGEMGVARDKKIKSGPEKKTLALASRKDISIININHARWKVFEEGRFLNESVKKKVGERALLLNNLREKGPFYAQLRISDEFKRFDLAGHTLTFGCWVYASTPQKAYIGILDVDGENYFRYSAYHSRGGQWEFLTVSKAISNKAEAVYLQLFTQEKSTAIFDGALVAEGDLSAEELLTILDAENDLLEHFDAEAMRDVSLNERFFELSAVFERFKNQGMWTLLAGFGNGAAVDFSKTPDITLRILYREKIHSVHAIHFLPLALLFRQGIIGLIVFLVFCSVLVMKFIAWIPWFRTSDENAIMSEICFLSISMILLAGFTATPHFFTSITAGYCLGLIGVIERLKKNL